MAHKLTAGKLLRCLQEAFFELKYSPARDTEAHN